MAQGTGRQRGIAAQIGRVKQAGDGARQRGARQSGEARKHMAVGRSLHGGCIQKVDDAAHGQADAQQLVGGEGFAARQQGQADRPQRHGGKDQRADGGRKTGEGLVQQQHQNGKLKDAEQSDRCGVLAGEPHAMKLKHCDRQQQHHDADPITQESQCAGCHIRRDRLA